MADKMRIEETLMVHGSMLIRLEAAAIRNERSFAEIRATLDRLVDRLEVLNTHLANQDITTINRSNPDGGNDDSNRSGEAETLKANVKDQRGINDLLRLRTLAGGNIVKTQYDQDSLIRRIEKPLGFSKGRPTAACIIYKCLCHWRSFEDEKTSIFDRIIQAINHNIETQDDNSVLAYWLSTASTLLALTRQQLEPKYPAVLFKQQLTAYVKKIYGMIRDNLKKEISPLLGLCIQAPRIYRANFLKGNAAALTSAASQDILIAHWQEIVNNIGRFLNVLKSNNVPPLLVRKIFTQIFYFINVQLFNSLLLRRECCSFSNAEYVKAGLSELEQWCYNATEEYAGSAWDELKHIRQAIGFMLINQKQNKTLDDISHDFCPVLSIQQLYRISTMYYDDKHYTHSLSPEVISEMRVLMTEDSNNAVSSSFLLDDDPSIPLSVDDLCKSMDQTIDKTDIGLPPSVLDRLGLSFLSSRVG